MSDNGDTIKETVKLDDLIIAVKRGENGIETLINTANRQELEIALMRLTHQVYGVFNAMSYAAQQEKKIIKPGIINFVRSRKR